MGEHLNKARVHVAAMEDLLTQASNLSPMDAFERHERLAQLHLQISDSEDMADCDDEPYRTPTERVADAIAARLKPTREDVT